MSSSPIFFDPKGSRGKRITTIAAIAGVAATILATLFLVTILAVPLLPRIPGISAPRAHGSLKAVDTLNPQQKKADFLLGKARSALVREIDKDRARPAMRLASKGGPIVGGFYVPWEDAGIASLKQNANKLTHLFPQWLHLGADGSSIDYRDWDSLKNPDNGHVVSICRAAGIRICPILSNDIDGAFHSDRVATLLASDVGQQKLIQETVGFVVRNHFQGLNLDFENLDDATEAKLPGFVAKIGAILHAQGLSLSIDLPTGMESSLVHTLGELCDYVVLMAYDEHYEGGEPGPIASVDFTESAIQSFLKVVPSSKLVLGIGNYAYDWPKGQAPTESLTYQGALTLAADYRDDAKPEDAIHLDQDSLNTYFTYVDEKEREHSVWMLDAVSAYNQETIGKDYGVRGTALWVMGSEDPSIWTFMDKSKLEQDQDADALKLVHFPFEVDFDGNGEILSVRATPKDGARTVKEDPNTGLITTSVYHSYPSSYLIHKSGMLPMKLALTFDDGPDPKFSGPILDYLKREHVPATFFVIGENAENNPDLVRRMVDEGHEVGSHSFTHPNMGMVSPRRETLELNATQRAIQSITGRSTILFRPPYNADSEPRNVVEVQPVALAAKLGYITVGESIDPQDWNLDVTDSHGKRIHRNAQDVASEVMAGLGEGDCILLHDGGGDRSATLGALKMIVPKLRAMGYEFVPVSQLAGLTRDQVMPKVTAKDLILIGIDKVVFWSAFTFQALLALAFVIAIFLGIARSLMVFPLALVHNARRKRQVFSDGYRPGVSALIAAFNEQKVIVRTIECVLASEYHVDEVIVVDDGSTDATGVEVERAFVNEPRVRLVRQENGGKATALNRAIGLAKGELLFCIDADTQLAPDAIGLLVRHFENTEIGAVAGNVKVGNRVNMLTRWQSVEYITSQNIDRRAYAVMNAVTVVPGAIGMWRHIAVEAAGGYQSDTLAEDMDLTWRIRRCGWRLETESDAIAYTEAPDTLSGFFKQRFRWAFGTLQCLSKHRSALGHYGWFGRFALPVLWLFQIVFQALAPLVDVQLLVAAGGAIYTYLAAGGHLEAAGSDWQPVTSAMHTLEQVALFYLLFTVVETVCGFIAFRMDREKAGVLWSLLVQRFVYRQVMYGVIYKSFLAAAAGARQGWGKLDRKATVRIEDQLAEIPQDQDLGTKR